MDEMARKRASLQGRGTEILTGARPDESPEPTRSGDESTIDDQELERPPEAADTAGDGQEEAESEDDLSPEWVDLLHEEALSAEDEGPSGVVADVGPEAGPALPPLATTPARPARPTDALDEAVDLAQDQADNGVQVSGDQAPAGAEESAVTGGDVEPDADTTSDVEPSGAPLTGQQAWEDVAEPAPEETGTTVDEGLPPPAGAPTDAGVVMPPAPMYSETLDTPYPGTGAAVPVPKEKPEATSAVLRAELDGLLYQRATTKPSDEDLEPEGPGGHEVVVEELEGYQAGQPSRTRREPEILAYVGQEQRKSLWDETLALYKDVPEILTGDANQARALRLLQEAQDLLLERPRQFDVAKYKVGQVQTLVSWRRNVNRWSNTYGWGIFVYEVVWIAALVWGVFGAALVVGGIAGLVGGEPSVAGLLNLWSTMMWGGLGGVIGAFYSLYWHVAKVRDFDKQYTMWYIVQPVIGLLLGALVHLLIGSGFLTARGVTEESETVALSLFPYAVACIAGFRQRFILEMIDRVIQVITPSPQHEQKSAEETVEEEPLKSSE
jgi:hypothetical protein